MANITQAVVNGVMTGALIAVGFAGQIAGETVHRQVWMRGPEGSGKRLKHFGPPGGQGHDFGGGGQLPRELSAETAAGTGDERAGPRKGRRGHRQERREGGLASVIPPFG